MSILGRTDLGFGAEIQAVVVDHDPETIPTDANRGSLIIYGTQWYKKLVSGSNTNVSPIGVSGASGYSGASGGSGISGISGFGISGYSGVSGRSGVSGYSGSGASISVQTAESESESTTTSTTYQTKVSLNLTAGTYLLNYCASISSTALKKTTDARFTIDGVEYGIINFYTDTVSNFGCLAGTKVFTVSSSSIATIQYRVNPSSSGTSQIMQARITAIRS